MLQTKPEWNDLNTSIAKAMWANGASMGDIARQLGIKRNVVAGHFNRNRDDFPRKTDGDVKGGSGNRNTAFSIFWSEKRLAKASSLWNGGHKRKVIAACVGCKADALYYVIRKFPSYFPARENVKDAQDGRSGNGRPKTANQRRRAFYEAGMTVPKSFLPDTVDFLMPSGSPIPYMMQRDDLCKWPMSDNTSAMTFCGAEMFSRSFCYHHFKIAYPAKCEAV